MGGLAAISERMGKGAPILVLAVLGLQLLEALVFVRGLRITGRWVTGVAVVFIIVNLPVFYLAWLVPAARQPSELMAALVVRPAYAWFFNWLCFLVFLAPLVGLARGAEVWFGFATLFKVVRAAVLGIIIFWGLLTVVGLLNTVRPPGVDRVEIKLPGLDPALDGLKIVQLSDPHVAWWNSRAEIARLGDIIAGLGPDLFVVTGDMVDHNPDYVHAFADGLANVRPRLGRFAIIGNHDVYTGKEAVARRMEERGFHMLRTACVSLRDRGAAISLAGYDDSGKSWTSGDPAANKIPDATASCPAGDPIILLAHRPPRFSKILSSPVALVFAGHTHGGQLRLPFGGPGLADLTFPHALGLYQEGGKSLYVTRGTGTVGWPFRLFCPQEISLIVLRAPGGQDASTPAR
jgi:uncharacterized protein